MKPNTCLYIALLFFIVACKDENSSAVERDQNVKAIEQASTPLTDVGINRLMDEIGDAQYVLLGEASHGTSEYYEWRSEITKRLITEKGFTVVGVEGDWPDLYRFNEYIRGESQKEANAEQVLATLDRWPTWMWANQEIANLGGWLYEFNQHNSAKVGFYGLDVYSLWDSMNEVLAYLENNDPQSAQLAQDAINCFSPYASQDEFAYAQAKLNNRVDCADELAALLATVQQKFNKTPEDTKVFNALQNATIAMKAERYYVTALQNDAESWNIRDRHMAETINRLVQQHHRAKIVVWEHNTHVGDARATNMASEGMVNVGQLVREQHQDEGVYIVGFGSYSGSVIAASRWGSSVQEMPVPRAQEGSWERLLHEINPVDKITFLSSLKRSTDLMRPRGHRSIGVVYNPGAETGNYVPTVLPERYDAFIFIDETSALHPIQTNASGRIGTKRIFVGD